MEAVNANKTGLVLAMLLGGWHLIWAVLVAIGWAQPVLNFVLWIHFIKPIEAVETFHLGIAVLLIAATATLGYVIGFIFATLWNWTHR